MPNEMKKENGTFFYIKLVIVLSVICIVVAGLLATVNLITKDVIASNAAKEREETIYAIFVDSDKIDEYKANENTDSDIYVVSKNGQLLGYSISVDASGFGGDINMMVGIDCSGNVYGVKIISLSETPGVGSKTKDDSFLSQYIGKSGEITVGKSGTGVDIDAISGATISSKAVTSGVNKALQFKVDLNTIASELGLTISSKGE